MTRDPYRTLSGIYDHLTSLVFLGKMKKAKLHFLDKITADQRVLIIGGGTALELEYLQRKYPGLSIDYLEASASMIRKASKRVKGESNNIKFLHQKELPETRYDAVISSFFLDLFGQQEMEEKARQIINRLQPGGCWILTDFEIQENSSWQATLTRLMYLFFSLFTGLKTKDLPDFSVLEEWEELSYEERVHYYGDFIFSAFIERI